MLKRKTKTPSSSALSRKRFAEDVEQDGDNALMLHTASNAQNDSKFDSNQDKMP